MIAVDNWFSLHQLAASYCVVAAKGGKATPPFFLATGNFSLDPPPQSACKKKPASTPKSIQNYANPPCWNPNYSMATSYVIDLN